MCVMMDLVVFKYFGDITSISLALAGRAWAPSQSLCLSSGAGEITVSWPSGLENEGWELPWQFPTIALFCFLLRSGYRGYTGWLAAIDWQHNTQTKGGFTKYIAFQQNTKCSLLFHCCSSRFKDGENWFNNLRMPPSSGLGWSEMTDQILGRKGFVSWWTGDFWGQSFSSIYDTSGLQAKCSESPPCRWHLPLSKSR